MHWWQIRKRGADLERELRYDLELEEEEQRESGLSSEEARYAARRAFGNLTIIKELTYETWGWVPLERLLEDLRYAVRQLRRSPGFAVTAMAILALGVGANVVVFSVMNALILRPLNVPQPQSLYLVEHREHGSYMQSYPDYLDYRDGNSTF